MPKPSKKSTSQDMDLSEALQPDHVALYIIEAMKDKSVTKAIREETKTDLSVLKEELRSIVRNELKAELDSMKALIQAKDDQISSLQKRIKQLETNQDGAEQYSRRNSVHITGLQEEPSENVENKVINFLNESLNTRIRPILVKFTSYRCKVTMGARSQLKGNSFHDRSVYTNEDLTQLRAKLALAAGKSPKDSGSSVKDTWTFNGRVLVRLVKYISIVSRLHTTLTTHCFPT